MHITDTRIDRGHLQFQLQKLLSDPKKGYELGKVYVTLENSNSILTVDIGGVKSKREQMKTELTGFLNEKFSQIQNIIINFTK